MTFFPDQHHSFTTQPMNKTTNGFYVHKFEEVHLLFLELLTEHQMMDGWTQRRERKSWAKRGQEGT